MLCQWEEVLLQLLVLYNLLNQKDILNWLAIHAAF